MYDDEDDFGSIDYTFKIVVAGSAGVGKSNLISRYIKDEFLEDTCPTIGVDFQSKTEKVNNKVVKLQFWDTAGQEKHKSIANSYYRQANGALLVYDVSDKNSFNKLPFWLEEMKNSAPKNIKIILLGNKKDLIQERAVSEEEGKTFAKENSLFFMEVSAKDNTDSCVQKAFTELIKGILNDMDEETQEFNRQETALRSQTMTQSLERQNAPEEQKKKGCC
jgi:Ras-related protein Rab-11A